MHGTAHWMAFGALFTGGTVIIPAEHGLDPAALWQLVAREDVNFLVIVGDAFARPLLDALPPDVELPSLRVLLSGGAILSPTVKRALVDRLPAVLVVDGYGASETGGQGQSVVAAGSDIPAATRFAVGEDTQVLDDELRPVRPGVVGRLARRGHIPLGSPSLTVSAGPCPATTRSSTSTERSPCSVAGRCRSTPAARRCTPRKSRRC